MLNLNSIMVGTDQPKVMGEFYEKVFERKPDMDEGGWYGWKVGNCYFNVGEHSEVHAKSKEPSRILLNLETTKVQKEYDRLIGIGATSIKEPYEMEGMWIATLADPDGNYFQLVTPWEEQE